MEQHVDPIIALQNSKFPVTTGIQTWGGCLLFGDVVQVWLDGVWDLFWPLILAVFGSLLFTVLGIQWNQTSHSL